MQDKTTFRTDRTAGNHRILGGIRIGIGDRELVEQAGELQVQRAVDDNAKRAFLVMFTNEGDSSAEIRIGHARHSDK